MTIQAQRAIKWKMSEKVSLYINEVLSVRELRQAAVDLVEVNQRIVTEHARRITEINPSLSNLPLQTLVRTAFLDQYIPDKWKAQKRKAGIWVTKMLVSAGSITYPETTKRKILEQMDSMERFPHLKKVSEYTNLTLRRHAFLQTSFNNPAISTIHYGIAAFAEDLIVEKMHQGKFFYNPRKEETSQDRPV